MSDGEFVVLKKVGEGSRADAESEKRKITSTHGHNGKRDPQLSVVKLSVERKHWYVGQSEWEWAVVAHVIGDRHREYVNTVRGGGTNE